MAQHGSGNYESQDTVQKTIDINDMYVDAISAKLKILE